MVLCHAGLDVSALLLQGTGNVRLPFPASSSVLNINPKKTKSVQAWDFGIIQLFEEPAEFLEIISALSSSLKSTVCPLQQHGFNGIAIFFSHLEAYPLFTVFNGPEKALKSFYGKEHLSIVQHVTRTKVNSARLRLFKLWEFSSNFSVCEVLCKFSHSYRKHFLLS